MTHTLPRWSVLERPPGPPGNRELAGVFWHAHKITHSYSSVSEQHVFKHTHTLSHKNNHYMFRWETQMSHTANTCNSPSCITFAFINVPDIFIQTRYSVFECIRFLSVCVIPWESNPWPWHCKLTGASFWGGMMTAYIMKWCCYTVYIEGDTIPRAQQSGWPTVPEREF